MRDEAVVEGERVELRLLDTVAVNVGDPVLVRVVDTERVGEEEAVVVRDASGDAVVVLESGAV